MAVDDDAMRNFILSFVLVANDVSDLFSSVHCTDIGEEYGGKPGRQCVVGSSKFVEESRVLYSYGNFVMFEFCNVCNFVTV